MIVHLLQVGNGLIEESVPGLSVHYYTQDRKLNDNDISMVILTKLMPKRNYIIFPALLYAKYLVLKSVIWTN
jgi:hypothetical protein